MRDALQATGDVIDHDDILDIFLDGVPDEYDEIKLVSECDPDFDLERAMYTMRNIYANRVYANRSSGKTGVRA